MHVFYILLSVYLSGDRCVRTHLSLLRSGVIWKWSCKEQSSISKNVNYSKRNKKLREGLEMLLQMIMMLHTETVWEFHVLQGSWMDFIFILLKLSHYLALFQNIMSYLTMLSTVILSIQTEMKPHKWLILERSTWAATLFATKIAFLTEVLKSLIDSNYVWR